jgi:hypothetical protein
MKYSLGVGLIDRFTIKDKKCGKGERGGEACNNKIGLEIPEKWRHD